MVRLLEAAAAGLTNIALLSEEVLIISRKLLLRGIFCSCREVQRQTKARESSAGGCAPIRFIMIHVTRKVRELINDRTGGGNRGK